MTRSLSRITLFVLLGIAVATLSTPAIAQVSDDFESYAIGTLPSPKWYDAGAVLPGYRTPPFPSAYVFGTTDKHGNATQAVTTVGDLSQSKGIYAPVPISNHYSLFADVRVDRYSDHPTSPPEDWAMQLTFGINGVCNWSCTPQAGIYASSLTGRWRLYTLTATVVDDFDLGILATPGIWYTVAQALDVNNGIFHSQIWDGATGVQLVDNYHTVPGWKPSEAQFDTFAFIGGDLAANDTYGNIGVIDNINVTAVTTPEPASLVLVASGLVAIGGVATRKRKTA